MGEFKYLDTIDFAKYLRCLCSAVVCLTMNKSALFSNMPSATPLSTSKSSHPKDESSSMTLGTLSRLSA